MSASARKRKEEITAALKKMLQARTKTPVMKFQQLFDDLRGQSETVSASVLLFGLSAFCLESEFNPSWKIGRMNRVMGCCY